MSGLRAHRKSGKLNVTWTPVCAAYDYYVTIGSGASKTTATTKKPTIAISGKGRRTVTVTAINHAGQTGKPSAITIH